MRNRIWLTTWTFSLLGATSVAFAQDEEGEETEVYTPPPQTYSTPSSNSSSSNQENGIQKGNLSLSFGIPGGGNSFAAGAAGGWYLITDSINLGANLGLAIDTAGEAIDLLLAPAAKFYLSTEGKVLPFALGQANLRIAATPAVDPAQFALIGGVGAEWFPVPEFSIAGYVGVGLDLVRAGADPIALGTFQSGLSAQMYLF